MEKYLTISVDDGHPKDLMMADLLDKFSLEATFYVPVKNPEREVMGKSDMRAIAQRFEIGGHTYNHKPLVGIPEKTVEKEVGDGKKYLEQMLGKKLISFCYPKGKFNASVAAVVQAAGFMGARTCMFNLSSFPKNPYSLGVSTHAYPHKKGIQIRHAILEMNIRGLIDFFRVQKGCVDWVNHFVYTVDHVERNGGIAHLYLHSWEVDQLNEWKRLQDLLVFLSTKRDLKRITNGELLHLLYERKSVHENR